MGIEVIAVATGASLIGGLLAGLFTARTARRTSPPRIVTVPSGSTNGPSVEVSQGGATSDGKGSRASVAVVAISDPQAPSSSALVEFLPESAATILGNPEARLETGSDANSYGFAYDAIVSSLPVGAAVTEQALQAGQMMRVVGYSGNLGSGALELVQAANGNVLSTVRDTATGQFTGQLQFAQGGVPAINPAMGALLVFQVMSIVTGQYYLHRIDSKLAAINKSLDRVEQRLVGITRANAEVAREMTERVFRLMRDGARLTSSDIDELREAEQLARQAFHQSRDALINASTAWKQSLKEDLSKKEFRDVVADGQRARGNDAAVLVYSSAVLGRVSLLRAIAESPGDQNRQRILMADYGELRERLKTEMDNVLAAYAPFSRLTEKKAEERFGGFLGLPEDTAAQVKALRAGIRDLKKDVEKADSFLPEPAKLEPAPVVVEMRRLENGDVEVCAAVARAT